MHACPAKQPQHFNGTDCIHCKIVAHTFGLPVAICCKIHVGSCNRVAKHGCVNLRYSLSAFDQTSIQTTLINF